MKFAPNQNQSQKERSQDGSLSKTATSDPDHSHPLLSLKRTIENHAEQQLAVAKPESMGRSSSIKEATPFTHNFSQIPIYSDNQEKISVSSSGDIQEQRADRVKQVGSSNLKQTAVTSSAHEVLATPGQALDAAARDFMEPRFGHDFSAIRVHTDEQAADSAASMNALAYTVGGHIVFGEGRYAPASSAGRRLLAHELAHVLQPAANTHIARKPVDETEEEEKETTEVAAPGPDPTSTSEVAETPDEEAATAPSATTEPAMAQPSVTPGGHTIAPAGMAACPDPPPRTLVVLDCVDEPSPTPVVAEKAVLPPPPTGRFGGDADRAQFAKDLAQCWAEREVAEQIEKRFRSDVKTAKKRATEEAKADTEATLKAATEGLDPKDRKAIRRAKAEGAAEAKKAAAKKIADAVGAITRQDVASVTAELATAYEEWLAVDFDNTMKQVWARYGRSWVKRMQNRLNKERKRLEKEKRRRPKVKRGETRPPAKSAEEIAAAVEAEMAGVRCDQRQWVLNQIEGMIFGWAVGRREQVDFRTIPVKAAVLKDFKPTYEVALGDRAEIPASLQQSEKARRGVAPELADFLGQLAAEPETPKFTASNRPGHGGGSWSGKGFSTDIFLSAPKDSRGFWEHSTAVNFLLALDAKAKEMGARWRVLYNDFGVAEEVNRTTGSRNVVFVGDSSSELNWHGPSPLILHFHLDLEIPENEADASQP